jgi:flagellar M-ring protein FliF
LERTIGKMRGIEAAQVHLALHEESNFRQQNKPATASVVLKTAGEPTPDVVLGIAHLVASSVDGLTSDRVTVLDDSGRLLSQPNDDGSVAALTSTQLSMQHEVESYLQNKAEGLVSDIVGPGNARVRVTAALNFDKIERQSETVDPEKQATSTEQRYEITPGPQGGAASSNVAMSYENSKTTESFSGAIGNIKRLSVAVLVNDKEVPPVGKAANDSTANPTYVARTPEELARIDALVRTAVGADSSRGDLVTVVASRFDGTSLLAKDDAPVPTVWERAEQFQKPGIAVLGFVTFLVALLLVLRALKSDTKQTPMGRPALAGVPTGVAGMLPPGDHPVLDGMLPTSLHTDNAVDLLDRNNVRGNVINTIGTKPDVSTRVVRAWLKEA